MVHATAKPRLWVLLILTGGPGGTETGWSGDIAPSSRSTSLWCIGKSAEPASLPALITDRRRINTVLATALET